MDTEEVKKMPGSENESVRYEADEKFNLFAVYSLLILAGEHWRELKEQKEGLFYSQVWKNLQEEKVESFGEAIDLAEKQLAASPQLEGIGSRKNVVTSSVEHFLETREGLFRSAFLPFLEGAVLAGLRTGLLVNSWWRLANYGFSVEPYNAKGESAAFPYRSVSDMKKKDADAFRELVEDLYCILGTIGASYHIREIKEKGIPLFLPEIRGINNPPFQPYPKDGFKDEEIAYQHSITLVEELYQDWEFDIELYLPFLVFRFEEALYYALKYPGNEYQDYLRSLNLREDWNSNFLDAEYQYETVMGEGK